MDITNAQSDRHRRWHAVGPDVLPDCVTAAVILADQLTCLTVHIERDVAAVVLYYALALA